MNEIKSAWIFYGCAAALVAYVLYMMIRKRRPERAGLESTRSADTEL
jgi:hypothetical protein